MEKISYSWFFKTLKKFRKFYLELFFLAIATRILALVEPFILQVIIDKILPYKSLDTLKSVIIIFMIVIFFQILFKVIGGLLAAAFASHSTALLGERLLSHLLNLPYSFFRRHKSGEIISRINETNTIRNFLTGQSGMMVIDILFIFIYAITLFSINTKLAIIVIVLLPIQGIMYYFITPVWKNRAVEHFDANAKYQSNLVETLNGIITLKSLNLSQTAHQNLTENLKNELDKKYKLDSIGIIGDTLIFMTERLLTLIVLYIGSGLVLTNAITLGQLIAFFLLVEKITEPIIKFSKFWGSLQEINAARARLGDILHSKKEKNSGNITYFSKEDYSLKFENISFSYTKERPVLENVNFTIKNHTLNLIEGVSGIGKTTIAKLACKLETPDEGNILFGDINIANMSIQNLRQHILYVPQDSFLFSGTLRDSLTAGLQNISDDEITNCLELAAATDFISILPEGLDTIIEENGSNLSGGQKQRIAIARALLRKPNIIIFDEPTSALDETTRKLLIECFYKIKEKITLLIITHNAAEFSQVDQLIRINKE